MKHYFTILAIAVSAVAFSGCSSLHHHGKAGECKSKAGMECPLKKKPCGAKCDKPCCAKKKEDCCASKKKKS